MFDLKKILNGRMNVPEPEKHVAGTDITPGMALTLTNGTLGKCTGATKPTHISIGSGASGNKVAVFAINSDMIFETEIPAELEAKEGDKLTLATDALGVTKTTTSGVAVIVAIESDRLLVRF